jgi:hypothetical protein
MLALYSQLEVVQAFGFADICPGVILRLKEVNFCQGDNPWLGVWLRVFERQ